MTEIAQQPAELDLVGVSGSPFSLTVCVDARDGNDQPVTFSAPAALVTDVDYATFSGGVPTVTVPTPGQVSVVWSGTQTAAILGGSQPYRWALQVTIAGSVYSILAGSLRMQQPTYPGASSAASTDVVVNVGAVTVNISLAIG